MAPDARVVYVDNDPIVLAHARALLTSTKEGVTDYIEADLRDTEIARFFDGLEMIEPGLVRIPQWRPASQLEAESPSALWGGAARKP